MSRNVRGLVNRAKVKGLQLQGRRSQQDVIYNSMANGQFFCLVNGCEIPHKHYMGAIARDLHEGAQICLSEVYKSKKFVYFLDIDHKVWGPAPDRHFSAQFDHSEKSFMYEDAFIKEVTECTMKCLAFTTTNTQKVAAVVTTTTSEESEGFVPFREKLRVCPFCNKEMGRKSAHEQCTNKQCNAYFRENENEQLCYVIDTSKHPRAKGAPRSAIPFERTRFSLGFHIRFQNLHVNVDQARTLAGFMRVCLNKHFFEQDMTFTEIDRNFFNDSIDFSCYGQGKGLRVVLNHKAKSCPDCGSRDQSCTLCGGRKLIVKKPYNVLGICQFFFDGKHDEQNAAAQKRVDEERARLTRQLDDLEALETKNGSSQGLADLVLDDFDSEDDLTSDASDASDTGGGAGGGGAQGRGIHPAEEGIENLRFAEAILRRDSWDCKWRECEQSVLYPATIKDITRVLHLTSIRKPTSISVSPLLDETFPVPVSCVVDPTEFRNYERTNLKRQVARLNRVFQDTPPEGNVIFQHELHLSDVVTNYKNTSPVPRNLHQAILQCVQAFSDTYCDLGLARQPPVYTRKARDRILVPVEGSGCKFCHNIKKTHTSNRIYFILSRNGLTQKCHNSDTCAKFSLTRHVPAEFLTAVFGSNVSLVGCDDGTTSDLQGMKSRYPWMFSNAQDEDIIETVAKCRKMVHDLNEDCKILFFGAPKRPVRTVHDQLRVMDLEIMQEIADGLEYRGKTRAARLENKALAREEFLRMLRDDPAFFDEMVKVQNTVIELPNETGFPYKRKTHQEWIDEMMFMKTAWGQEVPTDPIIKWDLNDPHVYELHCPDRTAHYEEHARVYNAYGQALSNRATRTWSAGQIRLLQAEREAEQTGQAEQ